MLVKIMLWNQIWDEKKKKKHYDAVYINGLVQDYSNSIASALELLQSCTKPSVGITGFKIVSVNQYICIDFIMEFQVLMMIMRGLCP